MKIMNRTISRLTAILLVVLIAGVVVAAGTIVSNILSVEKQVIDDGSMPLTVSIVPVNTTDISSYHGGDYLNWRETQTLVTGYPYDFGLNIQRNSRSDVLSNLQVCFMIYRDDGADIYPDDVSLNYHYASVDLHWGIQFMNIAQGTIYGKTEGLEGWMNGSWETGEWVFEGNGFSVWNDLSPTRSSYDGEGVTYIFWITYYTPATYTVKMWVEQI